MQWGWSAALGAVMFLAVLRYTDDVSLAVPNAVVVALLIHGLLRSVTRGRVVYAGLAAFTVVFMVLYPAHGPGIANYAVVSRAESGLNPDTYREYVAYVDGLQRAQIGWHSSSGIPIPNPGDIPRGELGARAGLVAALVAGGLATSTRRRRLKVVHSGPVPG